MVLEYYGRPYSRPEHFSDAFRRPGGLTNLGGGPGIVQPTLDDLTAAGRTGREPPSTTWAPYDWYEYGLQNDQRAFDLFCNITGFRGFPQRPSWGQWTAELIESCLTRFGPFMFLGLQQVRTGQTTSGPGRQVTLGHARLVVGVQRVQDLTLVHWIDPAVRSAVFDTIAVFNQMLGSPAMRSISHLNQNPMYLPQARPVRAVVAT